MNAVYQTNSSPIGPLYLVTTEEEKLEAVVFECCWAQVQKRFLTMREGSTPVLEQAQAQFAEYFRGEREEFDLPYQLRGTEFQIRVWEALATIPFGQTSTYKEQAWAANSPRAIRAVGRTNGINLLCIMLPCHRVIGSNGSLTGYAGGIETKRYLLELERSVVHRTQKSLVDGSNRPAIM